MKVGLAPAQRPAHQYTPSRWDTGALVAHVRALLDRPEPQIHQAEAVLCHPAADPGTASPLASVLPSVADLAWWRLDEAALDDDVDATAARLSAAWSAVHVLGDDLLLVIGSDDAGRAEVTLGVPRGSAAGSHWSAALAPDLLWTATARPQGWHVVEDEHRERVAVPRPGSRQGEPGQGPRALPPALGRLLALPVTGWCVVVRLRPATGADLAALRAAVVEVRDLVAGQLTRSLTFKDHVSGSVTSPVAESAGRALAAWAAMLDEAVQTGGWRVGVHVCAVSSSVLAAVQNAFSGLLGEYCAGTPASRTQQWDWLECAGGSPDVLGWLASRDLAAGLVPPQEALGGVQVRRRLPGGRRSRAGERPLQLGTWLGTDLPATVDVDDLSGHAFVSGITGSGKSTTTAALLTQLWNRHQVPFLVLDPVKADYEALSSLLDGGLRVIAARELSFNVLECWPGRPADRHIATVGTAFRGSFAMPVPVPFVASLLFEELAVQAAAGGTVDLHDAAARLDSLVSELGYQGEIEANVRASLGLRLRLLLQPSRAEVVAGAGSLTWLLERPTLVQLSDVGDDEERAFLTAVLVLLVADAARMRGTAAGVAHVTVVEEAHRLMPEPRQVGSEDGDAGSVSARLMTQLLAEIRAYGEAVVIVDQSPAAVAREALRNTNLKLAHRAVDAADQQSLGSALGLDEDEHAALGSLAVGRCLVSSRHLVRPQTASVSPPAAGGTPALLPVPEVPARRCCGREHTHHHASQALGAAAEVAVATWAMGSEPGDRLRERLSQHVRIDPRLRVACLVSAGVRRHVTTLRRLGQLDRDQATAHETALWSAAVGNAAPPPHPGRGRRGPWAACTLCPMPCTARAVVASGGLRSGAALRARLKALDAEAAVGLLLDHAVDLVAEWAGVAEHRSGNAVAHCSAVTAAADSDHEHALVAELRRLRGES